MGDGSLAETLTQVVRRFGDRGFSFDDLIEPAMRSGATVGELTEWLARARSSGLVEVVTTTVPGDPTLGRQFRLVTSTYPN
ncbi:MAG: hypothetical protein ACJ762_17030 [Solirubrobacteraceae bacterium]